MSLENKATEELKRDLLLLQHQKEKLQGHGGADAKSLLPQIDETINDIADELEKRDPPKPLTVSGFGGNRYAVDTAGNKFPMLLNSQKMTDLHRPEDNWSIGDFVRASMGFEIKNSSLERGTATVPTGVSSIVIDKVRAASRVIQAGASTIPLTGPINLAKITADPTVYVHDEGVSDIQESVPTIAPVALDPKLLVANVPLTVELVQDSPNLDQVLETSLAGAFGSKLDTLAVTLLLADAGLNESAAGQATAQWGGVMTAVAAALAADMEVPSAYIANASDFAARHSTRTDAVSGSDAAGVWLGTPPLLANMLDLPTSSMTEGSAVFGNFAKGIAIAVRQQLRLELVRWKTPATGSHALIAFMRAQPYILQGGALFRQLTTVE